MADDDFGGGSPDGFWPDDTHGERKVLQSVSPYESSIQAMAAELRNRDPQLSEAAAFEQAMTSDSLPWEIRAIGSMAAIKNLNQQIAGWQQHLEKTLTFNADDALIAAAQAEEKKEFLPSSDGFVDPAGPAPTDEERKISAILASWGDMHSHYGIVKQDDGSYAVVRAFEVDGSSLAEYGISDPTPVIMDADTKEELYQWILRRDEAITVATDPDTGERVIKPREDQPEQTDKPAINLGIPTVQTALLKSGDVEPHAVHEETPQQRVDLYWRKGVLDFVNGLNPDANANQESPTLKHARQQQTQPQTLGMKVRRALRW